MAQLFLTVAGVNSRRMDAKTTAPVIRLRLPLLTLGLALWLMAAVKFPALAQTPILTDLYAFSGGSDGGFPQAGLVQASDGNLYGTTQIGGANNSGTVFKITPSGTFTTLYTFSASSSTPPYKNADGANPHSALIQASDGNLYGTTYWGGAYGWGTVFKITLSGTLTTLYAFGTQSTDGGNPVASLLQATDGNLYGTTYGGGGYGHTGTVFKITLSGTLTTLYAFSNSDGSGPNALIQASDGNLYGTTEDGGAGHKGTVFKITPSGMLTTLYAFSGNDGASPTAALVQAKDGNFYSTTYFGGAYSNGTIFKITPSGTLTTLYAFTGGNDGIYPDAPLMQSRDGNLYGSTAGGGAGDRGTIFKITPSGTLTTLYSFAGSDGAFPNGLIQTSDGTFYGTTVLGGTNNFGAVFRLSMASSDFNGDGYPDLLFQNASSGQLSVWFMQGITPTGGAYIIPTQNSAWKAVGDGDFNQDGKPDILFQNTSTGQLALWLMNGATANGGLYINKTLPSGWKVVSIADFNGYGFRDLLLQNSSTGQLAIWYMNGSNVVSGAYVLSTPSKGWTAVGTGDFNKDGHPDILFQNISTGQLAVWTMNNNIATGGAYVTPVQQAGWRCVSVVDLNGDGWPDLVFQNQTSGQLVFWLMNGMNAVSGKYFSIQPQAGWQVVGPH